MYEAARLEAIASNRPIIPETWESREYVFRVQFIKTIERICVEGYETTPEAEHRSWMEVYAKMGWTYGEKRDRQAKTHPDMVPYDELPRLEREKDAVFLALCDFART